MPHHPRYRWRLLRCGELRLDGGGMFGIIPRILWTRLVTPDDQGRILLSHNSLLLQPIDDPSKQGGGRILIETGSGGKFDAKSRAIYGLTDRTILDALREIDCPCQAIDHAILTHLHFDHAGGLTRLADEDETPDWTAPAGNPRIKLAFPSAAIHVQRREWNDALVNRSVMTRTYLPENLQPLREHLHLFDSPSPFPPGHLPLRDEQPSTPLAARQTEILPGIFSFLVPGHTWGQQAIRFTDDRDRAIVFTPDIMPTVHHLGAAYNLGYDVESFTSTVTRRWFLTAAAENDWLLVLVHEPGNPLQRVRDDGNGWFTLVPQTEPT